MTTLLLVEDDPGIARFMTRGLAAEGWTVDWRPTLRTARGALAASRDYAAAILDLGLPDGDGLDLCRDLRAEGADLPVLMLTARGALDDRLDGFRAGADDYLPKPFAFAELVARLGVLIARGEALRRRSAGYGALTLDLVARTATIGAAPLALSAREFAVIACLAAAGGGIVARADLLDEAWGEHSEVSANSIDVYVGYVRRALADHPGAPRIETLRGRGFRLVPGPKDEAS
ncbi:MAG TPA: response regulator transcription factor [Sphingomonas sp.]